MSPINYRADKSIYHWDFYALLGF
ncbi:hypothetical protein GBM75_00290 [Enterococcus faecium]|nr:hypothetical protein GBM75_00290 [Enterococcus faecium]MCZ1495615.1 hypothetical protein [Enterococcus faecium]HAP7716864.1 hypothetical protein [Enterococcus faecium]